MTELTLEARIDNIARIAAFVSAQLEPLGCSTRMQRMLDIAIDELTALLAALDDVEVKGRERVDTLLGCMMAVEAIIGKDGGEVNG